MIIDNCSDLLYHPLPRNSSYENEIASIDLIGRKSIITSSIWIYVKCKISLNTCVNLSGEIDKKWISVIRVNLAAWKFF